MGFTSENEIEITGGGAPDRRRAASLLTAAESADEESAAVHEAGERLVLRCRSVDGLLEEEAQSLASQFPGLAFLALYFSKDGEFYGYSRAGSGGGDAESADFDETTLEEVGRRHDGDGLAYVRERFGLGPSRR